MYSKGGLVIHTSKVPAGRVFVTISVQHTLFKICISQG